MMGVLNFVKKPVALAICVSVLTTTSFSLMANPVWPKPAPQPKTQPSPETKWVKVKMQPNFKAPSAQTCQRDPVMKEVPGRDRTPKVAKADVHADMEFFLDTKAIEAVAPSGFVYDESAFKVESEKPLPPAADRVAVDKSAMPVSEGVASNNFVVQQERVTAGMVDDNADFGEYQAYLERHAQIVHNKRDVSERHLLIVRDHNGRTVADAEVAIASEPGYAMWARTDAGGRVWVHPNAFDPDKTATEYQVSVRKAGSQGQGILKRGDKSATEIQIDSSATPQKAQLDLVFLIDSTGSMGDEIAKLRSSLKSIVADVSSLPSQPDLCLGLVTYRDKGDEYLWRSYDMTDNIDAFQQILNQLQAGGGGDEPEAMNEALSETVHRLSWRGDNTTRLVILLADAPPHLDYGTPQYDDDMIAAVGKGIKVLSVGASGLNPQGEFIQRQIAQYTGGRFVFLTYANAQNPASGPGKETVHDVSNYSVESLDKLIVRLVSEELSQLTMLKSI